MGVKPLNLITLGVVLGMWLCLSFGGSHLFGDAKN
jgi:hypothetical protein